jgi:hypothetical protein
MVIEEKEETAPERRKRYRDLMAGGMSDKNATEQIWPKMNATILKNANEKKAKKEAAEAEAAANSK